MVICKECNGYKVQRFVCPTCYDKEIDDLKALVFKLRNELKAQQDINIPLCHDVLRLKGDIIFHKETSKVLAEWLVNELLHNDPTSMPEINMKLELAEYEALTKIHNTLTDNI